MAATKYRLRFRKAGDLRFLSHHDLMRVLERLMRRAELPFRLTAGFHPKPKMAFASALALGIVGRQEVVEIEFEEAFAPPELLQRLNAQAPVGLEFLSSCAVELRTQAQVRRARYQLDLPPEKTAGLAPRLHDIMQRPDCLVERLRPQPRRVDIRPFLLRLDIADQALLMEVRVTPGGSARPEEVLRMLGLEDELMNGGVLERTLLELEDEPPSSTCPALVAAGDAQPAAETPTATCDHCS